MRLEILQFSFILLFSSCESTPDDKTACVGSDVNIPWEYPDSAGMNNVAWEHINSSNAVTVILAQAAGSLAMVIGGYNIQHNTNGDVTITAATVANSGTYRITVGYSTATPTFTDDVVVDVYDPPIGFSFTETPSGSQTTFTCTADNLGAPAADLYIQVNGVDMTSSVSATVPKTDTVKCILSGFSVQCMNGVSGTVTSLCVQCPTTTPGKCKWCNLICGSRWKILVFILICITLLFLIGVILGCFLTKTTCCCECFYKGKSCRKCVNNYYCECRCCDKTPCGALCNIKGLPYWYQVLWASVFGSPVAFGIWLVWRCCRCGKGDQASNVVNAGSHRPGRPQPPPPSGANSNHRQLPDIHDNKGWGLSANYNDDDHPLASTDIPSKKPGALESIPVSDRQEVTQKKKKRKKRVETEDKQSVQIKMT